MSEWIKITPSLETGLRIIERLDNGKFRALINYLCSVPELTNNRKVFSHREEEKLLASLEVNSETLIILLDTIKLIYLQAAYTAVKPSAMGTLINKYFPISEEKVSIFTNAWSARAKDIVERLKDKSIFPVQVDDVNSELNIQSSSSAIFQEINPVVWLQLSFTGLEENSKLTVEMNKNDLSCIYNKFEDIQRQLDLLEWIPEKSSTRL